MKHQETFDWICMFFIVLVATGFSVMMVGIYEISVLQILKGNYIIGGLIMLVISMLILAGLFRYEDYKK